MTLEVEILHSGRLAVRFPYSAENVRRIKRLKHRRWVKTARYWEVLAGELPALMEAFALTPGDLPEAVQAAMATPGPADPLEIRLEAFEARILGSGFPLPAVIAATSFMVPGHRFSPKFKSGQWDGRRHLFSARSQKFPSGLWPRVRDVLDRAGVAWRLSEVAAPPPVGLIFADAPTPLRDYQISALRSAAEAGRGIIQIATGGGKTMLAAALIRDLARPAVFFVHTRELLYQTRDVFLRELGVPIGVLGDGQADLAPVMVATIQTAARIFDVELEANDDSEPGEEQSEERALTRAEIREAARAALEAAQVAIFDECHHVPADSCFQLAKKLRSAHFRYGLSATPWTEPGRDLVLEAALGPRVCSLSGSDLIRSGFLVAPEITMRAAPVVTFSKRRPAYAQVYRAAIVDNLMRNTAIAHAARQEAAEGRSVLILVAQVRHGEQLLPLLPGAGFSHGSLDTDRRREHLEGLRSGRLRILIATTLADEGLDIPTLDTLILAGGGKSAVRAYQRVGRTLRPAPGKTTARVIDFFDRAPYLDEHSMERLRLYRREPEFKVRTAGFRA